MSVNVYCGWHITHILNMTYSNTLRSLAAVDTLFLVTTYIIYCTLYSRVECLFVREKNWTRCQIVTGPQFQNFTLKCCAGPLKFLTAKSKIAKNAKSLHPTVQMYIVHPPKAVLHECLFFVIFLLSLYVLLLQLKTKQKKLFYLVLSQ